MGIYSKSNGFHFLGLLHVLTRSPSGLSSYSTTGGTDIVCMTSGASIVSLTF